MPKMFRKRVLERN